MFIYINGRFLTQRITGVQRYALEITKAIDKCIGEDEELLRQDFRILVPKSECANVPVLKHITIKHVGHMYGHLWEQLELPFYSREGFLINLCNCAPIIKKNQVVTIHDAAVSAVPQTFSWVFRTWYKLMYRVLACRLKQIFTVSEFSKKELHKYYGFDLDDIHVTYNGVEHIYSIKPDDKILKKNKIIPQNYVLAVSSMNPSKNFSLVMRAAKKMPKQEFVIAGGSNSAIFHETAVEEMPNIKMVGYVTDGELVALYKNAMCFVYPSLYEGFGIPPLEAVACGCPVIVSDIDVLHEVCGGVALYCDVADEDVLVSKINTVANTRDCVSADVRGHSRFLDRFSFLEAARTLIKECKICVL